MHLGVVFPQNGIGADREQVREYAETAETVGYHHLLAYDHVLGADPTERDQWDGVYDYEDQFHEPLTLFSHLTALTDDLRFLTSILVLPQRQTALAAKQTAQVDVLSGGRLKVGVGVGWNHVEYEALGEEFTTRGPRLDKQIEVLRRLWQDRSVTVNGRFHTISAAGINPLPDQHPIPLWVGGGASEVVLQRVVREGDGWMIPGQTPTADDDLSEKRAKLDRIRELAVDEGRNPDDIDVLGRLQLETDDTERWLAGVRKWEEFGATHLAVDTMDCRLGPGDHSTRIARFADAVSDSNLGLLD